MHCYDCKKCKNKKLHKGAMNRQKVIKYLTRLKYRELKKNPYWESDAPYLDNCIRVLKELEEKGGIRNAS